MTFTSYREANYRGFLIGIFAVMAIELVGAHLLLVVFLSHFWAWVATGLAVYSAWWIWSDWRGLQENPTRIYDDRIELRLGTRWRGEIPREALVTARRVDTFTATPGGDRRSGVFQLRLLGEPNLELTFDRDVELRGPFGIKKKTRAIRMQIDGAERFVEAVRNKNSSEAGGERR